MASLNTIKTLTPIDKYVINGAVIALKAPQSVINDKDKMVRLNWLADLIEDGNVSLDYIKGCPPVADSTGAVDNTRLEAIANVASRGEATALDAIQKAQLAVQNANIATKQINDLTDQVQRLANASKSSLDEDKISAEVASAIAKAFKPFAEAVKDAKAESVLANATKATIVDRKSALDVFGIDICRANGDPVMVDIWDAPDAPEPLGMPLQQVLTGDVFAAMHEHDDARLIYEAAGQSVFGIKRETTVAAQFSVLLADMNSAWKRLGRLAV